MILLLGATGYIGQAFASELRKRGSRFMPLTRKAVDYTRFDLLFNFVRNTRPSFIINTAGYTGSPNVDACETRRAETVQANTLLPQTIARVCYLTKTPWGHVSSGCIYAGARVTQNGAEALERNLNQPPILELFESHPDRFRGFAETDPPNFTFRSPSSNFYSGTKALAEEALKWFDQTYLWRPRMVFDEFIHPRNFLSRLQQYPRVCDGLNSLTHRGDFVRTCLDLLERQAPFGAYNIVNPGAVTHRQVAGLIKQLRNPDWKPEFWKNDDDFHRAGAPARRSNCLLDSSKLLSVGIKLRPVHEMLETALKHWQPLPPNQEWLSPSLKSPVTR